jgi:RNA polymerase sigma-70 factor (ECF subfamily)
MDLTDATTIHVQRSRQGDAASLAWLVEHISPALLVQARYRLGRHLRELYDPDDLVQDVWAAVLPRLGDLRARDGRLTPVLLRFVSQVLLNRYRALMKKHLAGKPLRAAPGSAAAGEDLLAQLPAAQLGVVTEAVRRESCSRVLDALGELSDQDREVIVLRCIEQVSLRTAARLLGVSENVVAVRQHRSLKRLRERIPGSVFAELGAE